MFWIIARRRTHGDYLRRMSYPQLLYAISRGGGLVGSSRGSRKPISPTNLYKACAQISIQTPISLLVLSSQSATLLEYFLQASDALREIKTSTSGERHCTLSYIHNPNDALQAVRALDRWAFRVGRVIRPLQNGPNVQKEIAEVVRLPDGPPSHTFVSLEPEPRQGEIGDGPSGEIIGGRVSSGCPFWTV